jgi:hypothetical protein
MALEETVTIRRPLTGPLADLVLFAKSLGESGKVDLRGMTDEELIAAARVFWDCQHGEND